MKRFLAVLSVLLGVKSFAQEIDLPQYINHMADNPFVISPSYAGIGSGFQARLNGVSQWIGVDDAPNTQSITVEGRFTDVFAGGVTFFNDKNGFTRQQGVRSALAYHITLSDFHDSFLSFALGANYTQFGIETEEFKGNDFELLPNFSQGTVNFDISMLYRYERFAISANVVNLLNKKVNRIDDNQEPEILRRISVYPVYTFRVNHDLELEPSLFVEYFESDQRSRTDANIKVRKGIRDGYLWAGLSYTFLNDQFFKPNAIAPLIGIKKNKFYLSYGFSLTLNEIMNYNYGSHMITIGFDYDRRPSLARCTQKMMIF